MNLVGWLPEGLDDSAPVSQPALVNAARTRAPLNRSQILACS